MIEARDIPDGPAWFLNAVAALPESGMAALAAGDVHYLAWGRDRKSVV